MKTIIVLPIILFITVTYSFSQNTINERTLVYNNGEIDFIESYLNICLLVDSTIDKKEYNKEIDILCREVEKKIKGYKSPEELIEKLNNFLFDKKGFKYNELANKYFLGTEFEKEEIKNMGFDIKKYILMPDVLKNREGVCISLSMLYLTLALKLNLPFFGVIVPNHFFVRYNDGKININIETTHLGKQISNDTYIKNSVKKNIGRLYLKDLNYKQTIGIFALSIGNVFFESKQN